MDALPQELIDHIHDFRPRHPAALMIEDFMRRIGYNDEQGISFALEDYRQEPDYFDAAHDGARGCVPSFYGWGEEWDDPRVHGGRGPRCVVPPQRRQQPLPWADVEWEMRGLIMDHFLRLEAD